jgi:hypothetical protein
MPAFQANGRGHKTAPAKAARNMTGRDQGRAGNGYKINNKRNYAANNATVTVVPLFAVTI